MEATIRVAMCIIDAAWDLPNLRFKLQPSLFSHSVFTDVIFFFHGHENQLNGLNQHLTNGAGAGVLVQIPSKNAIMAKDDRHE